MICDPDAYQCPGGACRNCPAAYDPDQDHDSELAGMVEYDPFEAVW